MEAGPSQNFNVEVHNQYPLPQKDFVIPLSNGATFIHPPFSAGYIVWTFPNNPSPARSTAVFVSKLLCNSKSSPMSAQTVEQLSGPHGYAYEPAALVAAENSSFAHGFTRENSVATVSDVNASVWSQFSFCNTENSVSHLHVLRGMKIVERNERPKYIGDESEEAENACTICLENLCTGVVVKTNCRHCFHKSCAYQSELHGLRSTGIWACPVCRDTVTWINLETLWQDGSKQNIDTSMESKKSNNRFKAMISRSGMLNSLVSAIAAVDTLSIFSETQPSSFIPIEPPVGMQHNTDSQSMMDKAYNLEVPMQVQRVPLDHKMFAENAESSEASKEPEYDQCTLSWLLHC
mmetsp:Transcript_23331/g.75851  ORF Transcript_23331/g.75851 Transcript_23331/m.75851 type:complete len:349 (-) Transcript_23331:129-1175(-)